MTATVAKESRSLRMFHRSPLAGVTLYGQPVTAACRLAGARYSQIRGEGKGNFSGRWRVPGRVLRVLARPLARRALHRAPSGSLRGKAHHLNCREHEGLAWGPRDA